MAGMVFGRLTVLERCGEQTSKGGRKRPLWKCKCECGNIVYEVRDNLVSDRAKSCGCLQKELQSAKMKTHGGTANNNKEKLYNVWCSMKRRCDSPNTLAYSYYGGRGISVCDEWYNDYSAFRDWAIENGYREGLSIDRLDNNKGYCPENCALVDRVAQANNRSSNIEITYNGETHTVKQWSDILQKNPKTIYTRISRGMDPVEALLK